MAASTAHAQGVAATVSSSTGPRQMRWGIMSTANIARKNAMAIADARNAVLHAVASRDLARAKAFADEVDAAVAYGSYQQLLDDPVCVHGPDSRLRKIQQGFSHGPHSNRRPSSVSRRTLIACTCPFPRAAGRNGSSNQHKLRSMSWWRSRALSTWRCWTRC